jgi:IS605 OrfB family transposase
MKISRSSKCSLRFSTASKLSKLDTVLVEYGRVVNGFIDHFWNNCPAKGKLLKPVVDSVESWFSARLRKVAAREAIDMVRAAKERYGDKAVKPTHRGQRMCVSSTIACLETAKDSVFDCWLHLASIGNGIILDLPIKRHKHFNGLVLKGRRQESYTITRSSVQFCFEVETGPKQDPDRCIGVDTGINALASLSTGEHLGTDIKGIIERIKRCKHGSKGQKQAVRALRQRMDEVAKVVISKASLVVVENLKNITKNTKRRLVKSVRRSIGRWNVRYWLGTLQRKCEDNRVAFHSVSPYKTSQTCSSCGHVDRRNRIGELFRCLKCGYEANADVQASRNILSRFLAGPYGAGCKPLVS